MNIEEIREYCLSMENVTEGFPFGEDTLVFKVSGKIFALLSLRGDNRLNLKSLPDIAIELRERYDFVLPGYHMNKNHWNTIMFDHASGEDLRMWITHSYAQVSSSFTNKKKS